MNIRLQEYQAFINALIKRTPNITARVISEGKWRWWKNKDSSNPVMADYPGMASILEDLTEEQRQILACFIQDAHRGGIFTVLAYLTDEINLNGLVISRHGVPLAVEPYGLEMYGDYTRLLDGGKWEGDGGKWSEAYLEEEYADPTET